MMIDIGHNTNVCLYAFMFEINFSSVGIGTLSINPLCLYKSEKQNRNCSLAQMERVKIFHKGTPTLRYIAFFSNFVKEITNNHK